MQHAASFHCLVEQWKNCEVLKPKPIEKWIFVDKKSEKTEESNKVVCRSRQVSMHEMRKRKQKHEEMAPLHGMYGSVEAKLEVERTI